MKSKRKNTGTLTIALVLIFCCNVSAQVCLTPIEVRTANLILDECERDIELLNVCEAELLAAKDAVESLNSLLDIANEDIAALERLDSSRVANLNVYRKTAESETRKGKVKNRLLWILGAVAVVETVVIGIAVGTR